MTRYHDISIVTNNAYRLAELINGGCYTNILYYEFHEVVDPTGIYNCLEGLEAFSERSISFYKIFFSSGYIDVQPANIHIAVKLEDEWFIAHDCGSNYYLGYGPTGILKLREACANKNIASFASEDKFEEWLKLKFGSPKKLTISDKKSIDQLQFEKLIKATQFLTNDMQRRPLQYQGLNEENIRDLMLTPINVTFKGRGNAEAKNCNGKTDILVKTKDGLNEHIFELKVWNGIGTLKETIEQLLGYLGWHNNFCGIIMFCYKINFTNILKTAEEHLREYYNFDKSERYIPNEFRFRLQHPTDKFKHIETHLTFVNLKTNLKTNLINSANHKHTTQDDI
ncbi:MAG: hypothetical protein H0V01_10730 [Bacteroidetes bacterium]|nr:hypothetical protein [Bacteroidota bacterium]HET6244827.1 hypothetical protein [Bacteroidia bacterium]